MHERIALQMRIKNFNCRQLAELTNLHEKTIRGIKIGAIKNPRLATLAALASALDQSIDYFVYGICGN